MKLKKLFFSILTVGILGLTSFSSAFSTNDIPSSAIITTGSVDLAYTNTETSSRMYVHSLSNQDATALPFSYYCAYVYNFDQSSLGGNTWLSFGFGAQYADGWYVVIRSYSSNFPNSSYMVEPLRLWLDSSSIYENGALMCAYNYRKYFNMGIAETSSNKRTYKFDYIVFDYNKLSSASSVDCSQDSNYLQCLENLNVANGNVATLSGSLNTCQSNLSSCQNSVDVGYQACIENLSGCNADKTNLTNYNDSLSQQLNECLAELPVPCEGTGCEETIVSDQRFSFFRENEGERFSLPVANNVFLPQGLRAYVDSGVVAIARIQEKSDPVLSEGSFNEVNSLFFHFFKTVIIVLFFALFLRFIKTLIYPLFIPKNKE